MWRFHPSWQARSKYTKEKYEYDLPSLRSSERTDESVMAGFDYLAASGSTFGFQLRRLEGRYPYRQSIGTNVFDNGYDQD